MVKEKLIVVRPGLYDIEICVGVEALKKTLHILNGCGWPIVAMTQNEEVYTVLFRRPADG